MDITSVENMDIQDFIGRDTPVKHGLPADQVDEFWIGVCHSALAWNEFHDQYLSKPRPKGLGGLPFPAEAPASLRYAFRLGWHHYSERMAGVLLAITESQVVVKH